MIKKRAALRIRLQLSVMVFDKSIMVGVRVSKSSVFIYKIKLYFIDF